MYAIVETTSNIDSLVVHDRVHEWECASDMVLIDDLDAINTLKSGSVRARFEDESELVIVDAEIIAAHAITNETSTEPSETPQ